DDAIVVRRALVANAADDARVVAMNREEPVAPRIGLGILAQEGEPFGGDGVGGVERVHAVSDREARHPLEGFGVLDEREQVLWGAHHEVEPRRREGFHAANVLATQERGCRWSVSTGRNGTQGPTSSPYCLAMTRATCA